MTGKLTWTLMPFKLVLHSKFIIKHLNAKYLLGIIILLIVKEIEST